IRSLLQLQQFRQMLRQHLLAGAYHGFAALQCPRYDLESRSRLVDHLDDHIDLGIVQDHIPVRGEQGRGSISFLIRMLDTHFLYRCLEAGSLLQDLIESFSHNAKTKESDRQLLMRFHLPILVFLINIFPPQPVYPSLQLKPKPPGSSPSQAHERPPACPAPAADPRSDPPYPPTLPKAGSVHPPHPQPCVSPPECFCGSSEPDAIPGS